MSGTEDFGSGGYGTGDAERAAAEAGPEGSARHVPPNGPRVHVPNGGSNQGAAAAGANGTPNGAPWLAAGSVPYAEAMFGGAGQDGQQSQGSSNALRAAAERAAAARSPRSAGAGRRGVPEAAGQVQTAGPGYPDPYAPEYGPDGYANGYAPHPGQQQPHVPSQSQPQVPQLPQQRYDAAPFDSGFTEQARFAAQRQQAQQQAQQQRAPQGGYEQQPADGPGSGFEPGQGFDPQSQAPQGPYQGQGRPYPGAGPAQQRPGFDEPTTEFMPGPLFDEPTVRPAAPPPGPAPASSGLNGRGSVFSSRQNPPAPAAQNVQNPHAQNPHAPANGAAPGHPAGTTQRPSMSGSGTWTAAPPPSTQPAPAPAPAPQPAPGQASGAQSGLSQSSASVSGIPKVPSSAIPRVPSQQAAEAVAAQSAQSAMSAQQTAPAPAPTTPTSAPLASANAAPVGAARGEPPQRADSGYSSAPLPPRPPLPDEPPPGPPPLPMRPRRAERDAQQQAQAQAQVQAQAAAPAAPTNQAPGVTQSGVTQSGVARSTAPSAATAAVRETLTPPRRIPQPPPVEQPRPEQPPAAASRTPSVPTPQQPQQQPRPQQGADDLTSERLRSVAPSVVPPRPTVPEPQPVATDAPSAVEVPEDDEDDDDVLHGSGAHQSQPAPAAQQSAAAPPVTQSPQTSAPTRTEATAARPAPPSPAAAPVADQDQPPAATDAPAPAAEPTSSAAADVASQPTNVPAPRGTRRRVPEPDEADTRTYAPTAAPEPDAPTASDPQPTGTADAEPLDDDFDPGDLPTAPQPYLHPKPAPVAPPQAASAAAAPIPTAPAPVPPPPTATPTAPAPAPVPPPPAAAPAAPAPAPVPPAAAPTAPAPAPPSPAATAPATAAPVADPAAPRVPAYDNEALAAVYRVIHERRDVRNDFLSDPVPTEVLTRILEAAHTAPSVGFSQPWDFLVIRDRAMRQRVHELAVRQRRSYASSLPKARARAFAALKIEAILDTPINIVVTCDPTRGGRHTLGRYTQPLMAPFSSCLAVENLWLAARAEGLGVGWVSFFDERELAAVLDLPDHLQVVAYLCVGYVKSFPPEPELAGAGWAQRRPLAWAVHEEHYGHRALPGAEPISLLSETVAAIRGLDPEALGAARDRQARMTKPPGSLGALEALCEQLAGLAGVCPPPLPEPAALAVFAADHGVHAQGVTPWPQEVTAQMVANFLAGGAVVNAFAKQVGAEVCVVDVGVAADLPSSGGLIPRKIRYGTADMTQGPALTREEATAAIEAGIETARDLVAAGNRCLLTGDMGIANTTASAALIAAFTGASPAQVTGYGTGIDEQTYAHKVEVVRAALELHRPDPHEPVGVLCAFGGLEHAALAGFILGAAALRVPVVLDGVIAGAAALVAQALSPEVTAACVAGHRSAEPGHALALEQLGITPLIDLELRLGEGSGAALALPLVGAAVRALREVATFDDAGVSDASSASVVPPHERERT